MELTKNELQFMNVLWTAGKPLVANEILELSVDKTWSDASLHTILKRLLKKGAVVEEGFTKGKKFFLQTYIPTMTKEDYYRNEVFSDCKETEIPMIFSALLRDTDCDDETMDKLEEIIRKRRAGAL
ncbi:MAG: BlaI/MecI/CopY family transcriptional regulator [Oscillospiraceae bacterium]|nr:BlaI/MecI/CopY family transcriptional regulator [Oscillospiraceae bacterium]